ncbi:MAG: DUF4296 domain-containing protein [Bacteroidales bacterium]|nr:DUF4296 domain-containing protein [Bacteroidales bacterium]
MSNKLSIFHLFAIILLMTAGCSSPTKEYSPAPHRIIDRDTMVMILAESYIAEGEIFYAPEDSDKQAICKQLYSNIFQKYGITKEEYIENSNYYLKQPEESDFFMKDVMSKVEEQRQALNEIER